MEPPVATLVRISDEEAVFEARPPRRKALVLAGIGAVLTLAAVFYALVSQQKIAVIAAVLLACGEAFLIALAVVAVRAVYRVELDFAARQIRITDRRGTSDSAEWTGGFDEIYSLNQTRDGLAILWQGGEPGPRLLISAEESQRVQQRFAR